MQLAQTLLLGVADRPLALCRWLCDKINNDDDFLNNIIVLPIEGPL